jgi:multidrug resistance efflux pump
MSGRGGGGGGPGGGGSEFMLVLQDAAKPGALIKRGDTVAEFDRQYMLTRLDDYRAGVAQTEASFKKMTAEMDITKNAHNQTILTAQGDYDKASLDLKTLPVRSAMDVERYRLAVEESQARLRQLKEEVKYVDVSLKADRRVAELEVEQSRIELRRAEANANRMLLRSPIDGLVVMQNIFRGGEFDQIKVGDQLFPGMMFMQIVDPSSMIINATVSQVDVDLLRVGQPTQVRFDAFPGLTLPARVQAVGSVAKSSRYRPDWVKDIPVRLKLEKMDPRVIPDLSVSCDVVLDEAEAPAILPREAVFSESGGEGQVKHYVWVRETTGRWQRRLVELGTGSFVQVAVRSGLKPEEVVALERPDTGGPGRSTGVL